MASTHDSTAQAVSSSGFVLARFDARKIFSLFACKFTAMPYYSSVSNEAGIIRPNIMKHRIAIKDSSSEPFTADWRLKSNPMIFVGESNYCAGVQFSIRKEERLPDKVLAKVKGEGTAWYEVCHLDDKTVLTKI